MQNGRTYHLAAILRRGKQTIKIGANVNKTHPKFGRTYDDGSEAYHMHAEMNVLRFAKPGDTMEVLRFKKSGGWAMARPCRHCIKYIEEAGIKKVRYTNCDGDWEIIKF